MGDPDVQGFIISGEGVCSVPVSSEIEVVGQVPEREYLLNAVTLEGLIPIASPTRCLVLWIGEPSNNVT